MKMFLQGQWIDKPEKIEVKNPYDDSVVDTVPRADAGDVDRALAGLVEGAKVMRATPAYERARFLRRTYELMLERQDDLARTITLEEGKILAESKVETTRAAEIIQLSAEEAKRLYSEVIPLDAAPGVQPGKKFGFTLRVPCGIVVAISPFNFPLHLVCHKVGPALAAGNAVCIKPASDTPLSAMKLVELLLEAGCPPQGIACLTGSGKEVGDPLCADKRVRKITFTGSYAVGEHICKTAGVKKVTMELGSNSPVIVMDDADLEAAAGAVAATGYSNAGQVCISAQRVFAGGKVYGNFLDVLRGKVESIVTGNPLDEKTKMGPMIRESDAERVESWIGEAVGSGAKLVTGGKRQGTMFAPTVLADVTPQMRVSYDEIFGPAVGVAKFDDIDAAIKMANDTTYGLSAGVFTQDIDRAMRFAQEVDSGNIHINWGPQWRADLMPYGGLKDSGTGKEGPKYAVEEMTELKMVVVHLK